MEFIQKKTADSTIEGYLAQAARENVSLNWDRFEGQLPACGFCETGLSCRDCLQGPCISHPFRDAAKEGICGKGRDILAAQSLLRLILKGAMTTLAEASLLAQAWAGGGITPVDRAQAEVAAGQLKLLLEGGAPAEGQAVPAALTDKWRRHLVLPEGVAKDLFLANQKLEGGLASVEEIILRSVKAALLASAAGHCRGRLKAALFGSSQPVTTEIGLGLLEPNRPNLLLVGELPAPLKAKILAATEGTDINLLGVATGALLGSRVIPPVTNYAAQEIPLFAGLVDLVVAGDRQVNPSLEKIGKNNSVAVIYAADLRGENDYEALSSRIVSLVKAAFLLRKDREVKPPQDRQPAVMGFGPASLPAAPLAAALNSGKIKGIAFIGGSGNVKYTQDRFVVVILEELLKRDILCITTGEAGVTAAKYGLLNPAERGRYCGPALTAFLASLGENVPPVLDFGPALEGSVEELLLSLSRVTGKTPAELPLVACFPEGNRAGEAVEALALAALGVTSYFWPALPVTGSTKTMKALDSFLKECFGASVPVLTDKRLEPLDKCRLLLKHLKIEDAAIITKGGEEWVR
jgi:carbon-monoxide dehydrogenase catalytic subunit